MDNLNKTLILICFAAATSLSLNTGLAQGKVSIDGDLFIVGDEELTPGYPSAKLFIYDGIKSALRYGVELNNSWEPDSIGPFTFDAGEGNVTKEEFGFTFGFENVNHSPYSTIFGFRDSIIGGAYNHVFGQYNVIEGLGSTIFGSSNKIKDIFSLTSGSNNRVNSSFSAAFGNGNEISETGSFISGWYNSTLKQFSNAFGYENIVDGSNSTAIGWANNIEGNNSLTFGLLNDINAAGGIALGISNVINQEVAVTIGHNLMAESTYSFNIGRYNVSDGSSSLWNSNDPLFTIGNGSSSQRKNALTVLKGGQMSIGTNVFDDRLTVNSVADEHAFNVQVDSITKFRIYNNGSIALGEDNANVTANDVFVSDNLGIGIAAPEAKLDVRGTSVMKMGSDASNPHLTIEETTITGYARIDLKNASTNTKWTISAQPSATDYKSIFKISLDGIGDVMTLNGSNHLGIGRSPQYPIHVGTKPSNGNGAHLTNGGAWTNGSSYTFKEDFQTVDVNQVLQSLMTIDILKWKYIDSDEGDHIGPIAEEFHQAFGLGHDEKYISTVDIDGIALAAIQALAKENQELKERLEKLERLVMQKDENMKGNED